MGSMYVAEVTINLARDLLNVNKPYGNLRPYVVVWVDAADKRSTTADHVGDINPDWNETLTIPVPRDLPLESAVLTIRVVHAGVNPQLVGAAQLHLREVVDEAGIGAKIARTLNLNPPQGRLEVKVKVSYRCPPSYGQPSGAVSYGHPSPAHGHYLPYGHPSAAYGYYCLYGHPSYAAPPPQQQGAVSSFGGRVTSAVRRMAIRELVNMGVHTMMHMSDADTFLDYT